MNKKTVKILSYSLVGLIFAGGLTYIYLNKKLLYSILPTKVQDDISNREIENLDPKIKGKVRAFIKEAQKKHNITLRIVPNGGGLRDCNKQNELYAKGRTASGNIVTNARCGESWHNFGLAVDVVEIKNGKALWKNDNWQLIGSIGKKMGFEWGGDWKNFKDLPHFQYTKNKTLAQMRDKHNIKIA